MEDSEDSDHVTLFNPEQRPTNVANTFKQLEHQRRLVATRKERRDAYLAYQEKLDALRRAIRNGNAPNNAVKIQKALRDLEQLSRIQAMKQESERPHSSPSIRVEE